jgi:hypothetical protein
MACRHDEREARVEIAEDIDEGDDLCRVDHLRDGESEAKQQAGNKGSKDRSHEVSVRSDDAR